MNSKATHTGRPKSRSCNGSNRHGMIKTKALNPLAHGSRDGKDGSRPCR